MHEEEGLESQEAVQWLLVTVQKRKKSSDQVALRRDAEEVLRNV